MSKIAHNKEQKRQDILKAAKNVFLTGGYVQASMDQIAADAQVTKQTVYRYFHNKKDLFQATLRTIDGPAGANFFEQLDNRDAGQAMRNFAVAFTRAHLTQEHLAIIRLLIAEQAEATGLTDSFKAVGPDQTEQKLAVFFRERFRLKEAGHIARMWTSMLLSLRMAVLMGQPHPTNKEVQAHAEKATRFVLVAIEGVSRG